MPAWAAASASGFLTSTLLAVDRWPALLGLIAAAGFLRMSILGRRNVGVLAREMREDGIAVASAQVAPWPPLAWTVLHGLLVVVTAVAVARVVQIWVSA